jgi:hypothetical protein
VQLWVSWVLGYVILVAVSMMTPLGMMVPDIFLIIKCLMVESADQVKAKFIEPSTWGTCMPSVTRSRW